MNLNTLLHHVYIWQFTKRTIIAVIKNVKHLKKPRSTLTYTEKLIATGMNPRLALIYAGILPKIILFKQDIHQNYSNPAIRTKEILDDISIFCRELLDAGEKNEVVNFHNKAYNDLIICLLINQLGFHPFKSQLVNLPSNKKCKTAAMPA